MSTNNAQSGRAAAVARRKAMVNGQNALGQVATPVAARQRASAPEAIVETSTVTAPISPSSQSRPRREVKPVAAAPIASAAGRDAAKEMRQKQKNGKTGIEASKATPRPRTRPKQEPEQPIVEVRQDKTEKPAKGKERRQNNGRTSVKPEVATVQPGGRLQSKAYRKAQAKGKAGQEAFKSKGSSQSGVKAKLANPDASTREIAKQVRADKCSRGKTCTTGTSRPTRQPRNPKPASSNLEESQTISGQSVSGTMVGQGDKKMTGAETGACQLVSGTEYLGVEEFAGSCATQPTAQAAKVTHTQTTRGQVVSGTTKVGRGESMTGNEVGTCSSITGTEYLPADQSKVYCDSSPVKAKAAGFSVMSRPDPGKAKNVMTNGESRKSQSVTIKSKVPSEAPQKVMPSHTANGNIATGTQVGRLEAVTGGDKGGCKNVTGTGYQSREEAKTCNVEMPKPANKVVASATARGQSVTGDRSGSSVGMTGAEAGDCQTVTGTSYTGMEQSQFCSNDQQAEMKVRQRQGANASVSGVQPGLGGLTGAQKGACQLVSGTHYQGSDQTAMMCDTNNAAIPGESDFPLKIGQTQMYAQPMAETMHSVESVKEQASNITGAGWDTGSKVTGTDGPWAAQRNASIRGSKGQAPMGASQFRPQDSDVPMSPITGSSGNTDTGAKVTLSGGARA